MDIKTNQLSLSKLGNYKVEKSLPQDAHKSDDPLLDKSSDDVNVALKNENLSNIKNYIPNNHPFDFDKIKTLAQAIREGSYNLNIDEISKKITGDM